MPGMWDSCFTTAVFLGPQTVSCHSVINNRPAFVCLLASFGHTHTNFLRTQQTTRASQSFSAFSYHATLYLPYNDFLWSCFLSDPIWLNGMTLNFRPNSCLSFLFWESKLKLWAMRPTSRPWVPCNYWAGILCSGSPVSPHWRLSNKL